MLIEDKPITIVIADDHPVFREGFHFMLSKQNEAEIKLAGEASNGKELLNIVDSVRPDVVVTDIKMPVMDGIEASRLIKKKYPWTGIIALSMFEEENLVLEMLDAGAQGYLLKNAHKEELIQAIKAVRHGGNYFSNSTSKKLISMIATSKYNPYRKPGAIKFSHQELKIIRFICEQMTTKEMAARLELSPRTVDDYRCKIQEKIGARCAVGIALYALKNDLVDLKEL